MNNNPEEDRGLPANKTKLFDRIDQEWNALESDPKLSTIRCRCLMQVVDLSRTTWPT